MEFAKEHFSLAPNVKTWDVIHDRQADAFRDAVMLRMEGVSVYIQTDSDDSMIGPDTEHPHHLQQFWRDGRLLGWME